MQRHIFGIGCGRYEFDKRTLDSFIEEARSRSLAGGPAEAPGAADGCAPSDREAQAVFDEIMKLYRDYNMCQSIESLVTLKCRLEEYSLRYHSHVLAEEVLSINSCLPYEERISCRTDKSPDKH